jgi:hypothetical protein
MPTKPPPQKKGAELEPQNEKALISVEARLAKMDEVAEEYLKTSGEPGKVFSSTIALARAMTELRQLMTADVMERIMPLMNTPLGFLTDRNPLVRAKNKDGSPITPYSEEAVRDCVIEGALRGFAVVGNEMNIIASRFYGAKAGFERLVRTFPGIANYTDGFEVPRLAEKGGAVVACWASWEINGSKQRIDRKFAVKGDSYSSADAYLGKAQRKLAAAVYARLTGKLIPEGEVGESEMPEAPAKPTPAAMPVVDTEPELTVQENLAAMLTNRNIDIGWFIQGLVSLRAIEGEMEIVDLPEAIARKCVEGLNEVIEAIEGLELAQK